MIGVRELPVHGVGAGGMAGSHCKRGEGWESLFRRVSGNSRLLHSLRHDSIPLSPLWRNLWGLLIPPGGAGFGVLKAKQNGTEAILMKSTNAKLPGALRFRLFPGAC